MKKIIPISALLISSILVLFNACEKSKEKLKFKEVYGTVTAVSMSGNSPFHSCKVILLEFPIDDKPTKDSVFTDSLGNYKIPNVPEGIRKIRFKPNDFAYIDTIITIDTSDYRLDMKVYIDVGQPYQGGIIAYVFKHGDPGYISDEIHGLIVYPSLLGPAKWGCAGNVIGGTETVLGSGASNTDKILDGCAVPDIAARICDQLVSGGYNDWYLPSKDELDKLFRSEKKVGIYENKYIWSSSEYNGDLASLQSFNNGYQFITNKDNENYVVAIRKF